MDWDSLLYFAMAILHQTRQEFLDGWDLISLGRLVELHASLHVQKGEPDWLPSN